jgi:hypothetical protein
MPALPVSSIQQSKLNHHTGACLELFQAIGRFEPTFIEAHQAWKMICKVRSLKSRMKTGSLFEENINSSNEVFGQSISDIAVGN